MDQPEVSINYHGPLVNVITDKLLLSIPRDWYLDFLEDLKEESFDLKSEKLNGKYVFASNGLTTDGKLYFSVMSEKTEIKALVA